MLDISAYVTVDAGGSVSTTSDAANATVFALTDTLGLSLSIFSLTYIVTNAQFHISGDSVGCLEIPSYNLTGCLPASGRYNFTLCK